MSNIPVYARISRCGSMYSIFYTSEPGPIRSGERLEKLGEASVEFLKSRDWRFAIGRKSIQELESMLRRAA